MKLSERSADFGAEQVILVRDEKAKKQLQAQIGSVALVLTILQSKGMEFDDVILWNFFSESPNPAGIRSLNALVKDDTTTFDARKNSVGLPSYSKVLQIAFMTDTASKGICSDLKVASLIPHCIFCISLITFDQHLYVAVTRARIQLFFVETNETAIASVVKLLTQDLPEALVDITKKDHSNVSLVTIDVILLNLDSF